MINQHPFLLTRMALFLGVFLCSFWQPTVYAVPQKASLVALDRIVARVNGDIITLTELNKEVQLVTHQMRSSERPLPPEAQLRKHILDRMVLDTLQLQVARDQGMETNETLFAQRLEDMARANQTTLADMRAEIEAQGIAFSDYRKRLQKEFMLSQIRQRQVAQQISLSKAEVDAFLNSPAGQDQANTEYQVGHILLSLPKNPTPEQIESLKQKADGLIAQLQAGTSFSTLATAHSQGRHALEGGNLGWRKLAQLPSLFVDQVPLMQVGEVSKPIQTSGGFHIITLKQKRAPERTVQDEALLRQNVQNFLYERKFNEAVEAWVMRLKEEAEIKLGLGDETTASS